MKAQRARNENSEAARHRITDASKSGRVFFIVYFLDFMVGGWQIAIPDSNN